VCRNQWQKMVQAFEAERMTPFESAYGLVDGINISSRAAFQVLVTL